MRFTGRNWSVVVFWGVMLAALFAAQGAASAPAQNTPGHVRTYYIAADEVVWDYAPQGKDVVTDQPFDKLQSVFAVSGPHRIGSKYLKAIYREYTDATFTHLKPRPADQQYLGILGPIIHAEVGDTIKVVFRNNGTHPYSIHPHGVFYDKHSEGMAYNDNASAADHVGGAVPPVRPIPTRGKYPSAPVPARMIPARSSGSTIRTRRREKTSTRAWSAPSLSAVVARRGPTARRRTSIANSSPSS